MNNGNSFTFKYFGSFEYIHYNKRSHLLHLGIDMLHELFCIKRMRKSTKKSAKTYQQNQESRAVKYYLMTFNGLLAYRLAKIGYICNSNRNRNGASVYTHRC